MRIKKKLFLGLVAAMMISGCGNASDNIDNKSTTEYVENTTIITSEEYSENASSSDAKIESKKIYFWTSKEEVENLTEEEILDLGNHINKNYYFDMDELYHIRLFNKPLEDMRFANEDENENLDYDNLGELIWFIMYDEFDENSPNVDYNKVIDNDTLYQYIKSYSDSYNKMEYYYNEDKGYGDKITNHLYEECGEEKYYVSTRSIIDFTRYFETKDEGEKLRQGYRYFCYNNLVSNDKSDMFFLGNLNEDTVRDTFDIYSIYDVSSLSFMIYRCVEEDSDYYTYTLYILRSDRAYKAGNYDKIVIDKSVINIDKESRKVTVDKTTSFMSADVPGTILERSIVE